MTLCEPRLNVTLFLFLCHSLKLLYRDYVDISVAVATPKGLVVPVVRNVESMNFADIELALAALGEKARKGLLKFF